MSQFEENRKQRFSKDLRELINGWQDANGKKLTQSELADAVFVARETVSGWCNGKSFPSEDAIKRLTEFFHVPAWYFERLGDDALTPFYEGAHAQLEEVSRETAEKIGLSLSFVSFLKENKALADAVISVSTIDEWTQSFSPSVPLMPENIFQFVSSSNAKIYPPEEVLYMLRVVQRDLSEYALFLINKWSKVIDDAHKKQIQSETYTGKYTTRTTKTGEEYTSPAVSYLNELNGHGISTSAGAALIESLYERMDADSQEELIESARKLRHKAKKKKADI